MKRLLHLFLALLACVALAFAPAARAQSVITNVSLGTTPGDGTGDPLRTAFSKVNTNFAVVANYFSGANKALDLYALGGQFGSLSANSLTLTNSLYINGTPYGAGNIGNLLADSGFLTNINFQITQSATNVWTVQITGGSVYDDAGNVLTIPAGSVNIQTNQTAYIGFSLLDGTWWGPWANIDTGTVWVGEVVGGPSGISSITQYSVPSRMPKNRIGQFLAKLNSGVPVKVLMLGDSLSEKAGATNYWWSQLFQASSGWSTNTLQNQANITLYNYAVSASSANYIFMSAGDVVDAPTGSTIQAGGNGYVARTPFINAIASTKSTLVQPGAFIKNLPDLVWISTGANTYNHPTGTNTALSDDAWMLEAAVRRFRLLGVPVIIGTDERLQSYGIGVYGTTTSQADLYSNPAQVKAIADNEGAAVVDTARWVDYYQQQVGTNLWNDGTGHMTTFGMNVWARAVRGVLNPWQQEADAIQPALHRITHSAYWPSGPAPSKVEMIFTGTALSGTTSGQPGNDSLDPAVVQGGKSLSTSDYVMTNGCTIRFGHHAVLAMDLIYSMPSGGGCSIVLSGSSSKTVVLGGAGTRFSNTPLLTVSDIQTLSRAQWGTNAPWAGGWQMLATNFTGSVTALNVIGVAVYTWESSDIPFSSAIQTGTWAYDTATPQDTGYGWLYSDDKATPFSLTIPWAGDLLIATLFNGQSAGKLNAYNDGVSVMSSYDFYNGTPAILSVPFWPANTTVGASSAPKGYAGSSLHRHFTTLTYAGATNSSCIGSGTTAGANGTPSRTFATFGLREYKTD